MLTGHDGFVTAAGYVGPHVRVDHDISLLVPEVWCRMSPEERDPQFLIANGYLEKCEDFEMHGQKVLASRLGYRINAPFRPRLFRPRLQPSARRLHRRNAAAGTAGSGVFAGRHGQHRRPPRSAWRKMYFDDGSIAQACPPLKALLHIMVHDEWEGRGLDHPELRRLFTREYLLASDWYAARLKAKQSVDRALWKRHVEYLSHFMQRPVTRTSPGSWGLPTG